MVTMLSFLLVLPFRTKTTTQVRGGGGERFGRGISNTRLLCQIGIITPILVYILINQQSLLQMPRKRVNLSLDDESYSVISEYAEVIGTTPTRVIHQVLKEVIPTFKSLTVIANKASYDRSKAIADLQSLVISNVASVSSEAASLNKGDDQMELLNDND